MSGVPANILQVVQTYQTSALAYLINQSPFFHLANMKFKDFNKMTANLGDTVNFDKPYRFVAYDSLTITAQATEQRIESLVCNKAKNIAPAFSAENFIFNVEQYMDQIGMGGIKELASVVERDIASSVLNTYRFYGDGVTPISTREQLATAAAYFRNYGAPDQDTVGVIDDIAQASIVGSDLSKFVVNRNDVIANSWEIGNFSRADWYASNLLPTHTAGYAGINGTTITFVSISPDGTQITFSGAGSHTDFFKENDLLYFQATDLKYLTFIGHAPSRNQVQVRVTADADSSAGAVTVNVYPALIYSGAGTDPNANLTRALTGSDTAKVIPSHRAGVIMAGRPLFVAMPRLPDESPYPTSSTMDDQFGVSLRMYYGVRFGENFRALVHDVIYGYKLVPEYAMRLVFPLT